MGKKSRLKKLRRDGAEKELKEPLERKRRGMEFFLFEIIRWGVYLSLFTPLIVSGRFYFPFVGPKSLFFMGFCQVIFFVWLILILNYPQYRPKLNSIFLALSLFLGVLILSSILGIDFSRSFWSKYERMTGILMSLHLFGFFLAISSVFKRVSDWEKVFIVSIFVAILVSSIALLEMAGVESFKFSDRGGATLGNDSFLGTYFLFNAFLALWLFFQNKNWGWRIYSLTALGLMVPIMHFQGARAATISFFGGLALLFLLWLAFQVSFLKLRILGKILLAVFIILILASFTLLFVPESFIQQKFVALATRARLVNWEIAQKAFLERPILGWGPENYTIIFTRYFHPCLFISECGGEIWFDRTHNIVFDTLATTGILGFLTYLGLFATFFYVLWRKYFWEKTIDFWTFGIFIALPTAYFVQNLTVFDMVASLMMFFLVLGLGAFLATLKKAAPGPEALPPQKSFSPKYQWLTGLLIVVFFFSFFTFVWQPFKTDALVIKALTAQTSQQRIELYQKTLETSPLGKYQIREFFAQQSQTIIQGNIQKIPQEDIAKELDFLISQLEKTEKESPLDYRSILRMAHLYNIYSLVDVTKLEKAEHYGRRCLELSPTNQQGYWALAQSKLYQMDFEAALGLAEKAIALEPKLFQSHQIAVQIAQFAGDQELAQQLAQKAVEINPEWQEVFQEKEEVGENGLDRAD